ncbi:hypothetical protein OSB04_020008 [Centaurea solstitialis]|uniref:Uncharacterized protein n=1 Tax=Centaurea solstitialis TaxID=347529 RepID=A0AA38T3L5_9ASTR|nr:hypothetical protein OSB04_020008 [Centaurea solstitialis]
MTYFPDMNQSRPGYPLQHRMQPIKEHQLMELVRLAALHHIENRCYIGGIKIIIEVVNRMEHKDPDLFFGMDRFFNESDRSFES